MTIPSSLHSVANTRSGESPNELDTSDDSIWIEIDAEVASEIEAGNIQVLDRYLDPISGIQTDQLLEDFPTVHNFEVVTDSLAKSSSTNSSQTLDILDKVETIATTSVEKNPHGCRLLPYGTKGISGGVMRMHLRTDSGISNYGIIGWKPYTQCNTAPSIIQHQNTYYRTTLFGLWYPELTGATEKAYNTTKYQQLNISWKCKNRKTEDWMGRTIGTVTAKNGKVYAAQQHTQKFTTKCGI